MRIIGLTGGIATGKSTVSTILREEMNVRVIDADLLARKAVEPRSSGLKQIAKLFGPEVISSDGNLDRKKLASIVFSDKKAIKVLNSIVHPEVNRLYDLQVEKHKNESCKIILYDCPLLIEENLMDQVDEIMLVIADYDTQLNRLMSRNNMNLQEANDRIKMQMDLKNKIPYADYIVYNDGSYEELKRAVVNLWTEIIG